MTLEELNIDDTALVVAVHGKRMERLKFLDVGLTPNTRIFVRNIAPTGDPMDIELRSYSLTLRRSEAALIEVERIDIEDAQDAHAEENANVLQ